ncbi:UNVERIFIED_CONTAM: hypothetical protein O8I53_11255 [Campylobacter lari]
MPTSAIHSTDLKVINNMDSNKSSIIKTIFLKKNFSNSIFELKQKEEASRIDYLDHKKPFVINYNDLK